MDYILPDASLEQQQVIKELETRQKLRNNF